MRDFFVFIGFIYPLAVNSFFLGGPHSGLSSALLKEKSETIGAHVHVLWEKK